MRRVFRIGERVWWEDDYMQGWGTVGLLNHQDTIKEDVLSDYDGSILLIEKDSGGEIETTPSCVYQITQGVTFKGYPVVWDHRNDSDYPFYCPDLDENCFHHECNKRPEKLHIATLSEVIPRENPVVNTFTSGNEYDLARQLEKYLDECRDSRQIDIQYDFDNLVNACATENQPLSIEIVGEEELSHKFFLSVKIEN